MAAIMHKRKRSVEGSNLSMAFSSAPSTRTIDISTCLNSRTLKRFRDTRPAEKEIHQRTLGLLYSAQQRPQQTQQQQQQQRTPPPAQEESPAPPPSNTHHQQQQQSLHRFWSIQSAPHPVTTGLDSQAIMTPPPPTSCEDCGTGLAGGKADGEGGMDVDGQQPGDMACGACGKVVCFSCSVSNLGDEKRCLRCVGRRPDSRDNGWTVPVS